MKKLVHILLLSISTTLSAQNHEDALRYSYNNLFGSARSNGMTNAFGALGGDFSSLSNNPAGIGVYRQSEFSFTPELQSNSTKSDHYGYNADDFKISLANNQIGYIGVINTNNSVTGWLNVNIGVGINQINDFNKKTKIAGYNNDNSLIDNYINYLNNFSLDVLDNIHDDPTFYQGSNLAWQNYLIDVDTTLENPFYRSFALDSNLQSNLIIEKGKINEAVFSIGANYSNKVYIGGTIGSPKVRYSKSSIYREETQVVDSLTLFENFTLDESLKTEGRGYNAKIGIIYRPNDNLRLGATFHTPTYYELTDTWSTSMETNFIDANYSFNDPEGRYEYGMLSPYKLTLSAANTFGKFGLLSVDADIIDYTSMQLFSLDNSYSFLHENNAIDTSFTTAINIKAGGEIRLGHYTIRGGYGFIQDAYKNRNNHTYNASLGAGYRDENFYFDIAYSLSYKTEQLYLYNHENLNASKIDNNLHRVTTTIGIRF